MPRYKIMRDGYEVATFPDKSHALLYMLVVHTAKSTYINITQDASGDITAEIDLAWPGGWTIHEIPGSDPC